MTATDWPAPPGPRVRHTWRCVGRGEVVEAERTDPDGRSVLVLRCVECGGDDLVDRLRADRGGAT